MRRGAKPTKPKVEAKSPVARTSLKNHGSQVRNIEERLAENLEREKVTGEILQEKNRALTETLEQQTATSEVLTVISESPTDVGPVFAAILRNGLRLSGASYGAVFHFEDGECSVSRSTSEVQGRSAGGVPPDDRAPRSGQATPRARVARERRPVTTDDIQNDPRFAPPVALRSEGMRSVLAVPMMREGRLVGALTFHTREVRPFSDKQVALVETFADQAVIAIENARLFKELQARTRADRGARAADRDRRDPAVISRSPTDLQPVFDASSEARRGCATRLSARSIRLEGGLLQLRRAAQFRAEALEARAPCIPAPLDRVA